MGSREVSFVTFCVGALSDATGQSERRVFDALDYSMLLTEYILPSYNVLHTFSKEYIVDNLFVLIITKRLCPMKVFYASSFEVVKPDVIHSRDALDFGKGFYLTPHRNQAVDYANRFTREGIDAYLNIYILSNRKKISW